MSMLGKMVHASASVLGSYRTHHGLLSALIRREVAARYRGSALGILWSFITPLALLATYTLVFGYFFRMRWSPEHDGPGYFVIMLFCGLIPFNFFSEVISRSPELILRSPNYVKRIAFPVQLLPAVVLGASLFHAAVATGLLLGLIALVIGTLPITALFLPLIWLPLVLFTLSVALLVSAAGIFVRDMAHGVGLVLSIMFFLTPIIYPAGFIPEAWRAMLWLNPVACAVLQIRETCVEGIALNFRMWGYQMTGAVMLLALVAGWFKVMSRRFADVM
jgi:lipopolysaccharide transport system permease protein